MLVFSSPEPTASVVRCPSVCRPHSLNIFSQDTVWPIEAKFHMVYTWEWGTNVCSNGPGHMTKWPPCPYMVKTLKIFYSGTKCPMTLKLGMKDHVLEYYTVCSNDDPGLTLTYFTTRSNLVPYAFVWEKVRQWIFQKLLSSMI